MTTTKANRLGNVYSVLARGKGAREFVEEKSTRAEAMRFARFMRADGFDVEVYRGEASAIDSPFNAPIARMKGAR